MKNFETGEAMIYHNKYGQLETHQLAKILTNILNVITQTYFQPDMIQENITRLVHRLVIIVTERFGLFFKAAIKKQVAIGQEIVFFLILLLSFGLT